MQNDEVKEMQVRYRTVGDMTCTGAVVSNASNIITEIIQEVSFCPSNRAWRSRR